MWERLREYLLQYVGTGWTVTNNPLGLAYISRIERANPEELLQIAHELGLEN